MTNYLSLDSLLYSDGFVKYDTDDKINPPIYSKLEIYEMMHRENPIKKLKEFGMFNDKDEPKYDKMEYDNIYDVHMERGARYLLSKTYTLEKDIINNEIEINYIDINCKCPLYHLSILDENGYPMDESLYTIEMLVDFCNHAFTVSFSDSIKDESQILHNIFDSEESMIYKKIKVYKEIIGDNYLNKKYIFNDYTDKFIIRFDDSVKINKIKVICKVHDIYCYGGFFWSGWMYG